MVVTYLKQYESTGFTSPVWQGYSSRAILEDFTVTFDTHGGSDIDPATVTDGDPVRKPADPTRDGFTFTGWYTSTDTTTANVYDFTAPVTGDLTLHAGWEANPAASTSNVGKDPGETTLAATGGNPAPWFPVTAMILLTAGILVLVYRSKRGTSNP